MLISSNPSLKLDGHSGCSVKLNQLDGEYYVTKSSPDRQYSKRLQVQMEKQRLFSKQLCKSDYFLTPKILSSGHKEGKFWFDMEYVNGFKALDFFAVCDINALKLFSHKIIEYFELQLRFSSIVKSPKKTISDKIDNLSSSLSDGDKIDKELHDHLFSFLYQNIPTPNIYSNACHGDFCLSNMIFTSDHVFILDFLDSFLDSPIIDIVKLRQDTQIQRIFSIDLGIDKSRINRAKISVQYVDRILDDYIKNNEIINSWYTYLQILNLARILPYTKCPIELHFLKSHIQQLLLQ